MQSLQLCLRFFSILIFFVSFTSFDVQEEIACILEYDFTSSVIYGRCFFYRVVALETSTIISRIAALAVQTSGLENINSEPAFFSDLKFTIPQDLLDAFRFNNTACIQKTISLVAEEGQNQFAF